MLLGAGLIAPCVAAARFLVIFQYGGLIP